MIRQTLLVGLTASLLAGCSFIPEYLRPSAPTPAAWPAGPAYDKTPPAVGRAADLPWQQFVRDDRLRRIVELGLGQNRDLRVAALNVDRAQAQYRVQRANLFPQVDAGAAATIQRAPGVGPENTTSRVYSANVSSTAWEIDFFGRLRSLNEQALEQYFATEEARRSTQIALIATIATDYLTLAADRQRLQLAEGTFASREASYQLVQRSFELGVASALDLSQARSSMESARVDIGRYTSLVAIDRNALDLVVGTSVPENLLPAGEIDTAAAFADVPIGLPSDVLQQRPDILSAEHSLKAANASIGAARANFFPRVTLTGSTGFASDQLSGLFKSGGTAWSFAPQVSVPIFDAGQNQATLDASRVDRAIAVAQYEQAIQTAFKEVADALANYGTLDQRMAAQVALVNATQESFSLSEARYQRGIDSYLDVLDSQRSLYAAQQDLITMQLTKSNNQVELYKTLGGGWTKTD
jgi:multidrug efflux system outer membrane protein